GSFTVGAGHIPFAGESADRFPFAPVATAQRLNLGEQIGAGHIHSGTVARLVGDVIDFGVGDITTTGDFGNGVESGPSRPLVHVVGVGVGWCARVSVGPVLEFVVPAGECAVVGRLSHAERRAFLVAPEVLAVAVRVEKVMHAQVVNGVFAGHWVS